MSDDLAATCYFRVIVELHFPMHAAPGTYLGVWPLEQNLWLYDETGGWVLRRRSFEEGKLWSLLGMWLEDGFIEPLSAEEERRFRSPPQPLRVADVPGRAPFRIIWRR